MFKLNLLITPGIEYEVGVGENTTVGFRIGTGFAYRNTNEDSEYGIFSSIEVGY